MGRSIPLLAIAGVDALLTACGVSTSTSQVATAPAKSGSSAPATSSAPKSQTAKIGDTAAISGNDEGAQVSVTVLKVVATAKSDNEYMAPEAGKRFVAVQFKIANTGKVSYDDAPSNVAKVIDSEGQQFDSTIADTTAGPSLPASVKLAPGGTAKGYITCEVPKNAKITGVQFSMDSGFGRTGEWKVS